MAALLYAAKAADCPFEIVLVAADSPDAAGLRLAEGEGIPALGFPKPTGKDKSQFFEALDLQIRKSGADYIALAGFMRILPSSFVGGWEGRMLNIHPSLLPKYKGLDTHKRALEAGDSHAGCSVHIVTAELDDGPVLGQTPVAILPGDTEDALAARILIAEHQLYSRVLAEYVQRDSQPEAILAQVRERAMALPRAEETLSHGMPCFGIEKGKKFAYFTKDHHGDGITALIVKTTGEEEQAMLIEEDPDLYYRPAYFGPSGWIGIRLDGGATDWDHVRDRLETSWRLIAPRKLADVF